MPLEHCSSQKPKIVIDLANTELKSLISSADLYNIPRNRFDIDSLKNVEKTAVDLPNWPRMQPNETWGMQYWFGCGCVYSGCKA